MRMNIVGAFIRNSPFGTEIAFKKGLEKIGVSVNAIDTSYPGQVFDMDADFTLVFKWMEGDYWGRLDSCPGPKVVYQPDDLRFPHIQDMMRRMRRHCEHALTFDATGARLAKEMGYVSAEPLLLTADPDLYRRIPGIAKDIDFCFIGSLTGGSNHASRVRMLRVLQENGFNVAVAADLYDIERIVRVYNMSKVVLNHATDVGQDFGSGYGYQCRHFEAGFTGACILSNSVLGAGTPIRGFYTFADERTLLDSAQYLIDHPELVYDAGRSIYSELNDFHRPEHRAAQLVDFLGRLP